MTEGRTHITLASPPCGVLPPPNPRRTHGRSGRASVTAGTLSPVGDDVAGEDVKRYVEGRDAHRDNPYVMPTDHEPREWYDEAESLRQGRLRRWQAIR